tara:strand:+ start:337 stop:1176 length:840 start_codon:yes stop_codon:yes gene_type:complete
MQTKRKETSTLTIESFIDSSEYNENDPIRIECGVTTDTTIFKPFFAQRPRNENRCKKIAKEMKKYGNFSAVDCVKRGRYLYVWDGQHVLRAAELAGKPINYDVYNKVPEYILSVKSSNTKAWTLDVTHKYFLDMDDPIAQEVQDFIEYTGTILKRPIGLTAALRLLSGSYSNQHYKDRNYKVTHRKNAEEIVECLVDIAKYKYFATDSKFVSSFQMVYNSDLYDHSVMKRRLRTGHMQLHNQLKVKDIVKGIQECYNYRSRSKYVDFMSACGIKDYKTK